MPHVERGTPLREKMPRAKGGGENERSGTVVARRRRGGKRWGGGGRRYEMDERGMKIR